MELILSFTEPLPEPVADAWRPDLADRVHHAGLLFSTTSLVTAGSACSRSNRSSVRRASPSPMAQTRVGCWICSSPNWWPGPWSVAPASGWNGAVYPSRCLRIPMTWRHSSWN